VSRLDVVHGPAPPAFGMFTRVRLRRPANLLCWGRCTPPRCASGIRISGPRPRFGVGIELGSGRATAVRDHCRSDRGDVGRSEFERSNAISLELHAWTSVERRRSSQAPGNCSAGRSCSTPGPLRSWLRAPAYRVCSAHETCMGARACRRIGAAHPRARAEESAAAVAPERRARTMCFALPRASPTASSGRYDLRVSPNARQLAGIPPRCAGQST
jgi:hypothetical protein